jgi:hypothetical protein
MVCLLRRDREPSSAQLGTAAPPYRDWTWRDLGQRIGGPAILRLPNGDWVVGVRLHDGRTRTALCRLDVASGKLSEWLPLPSSGDSSYPGLVWHQDRLFVSYYSSHEGKSAIYVARVKP